MLSIVGTCWLVVQHLDWFNYMLMGRQMPQCTEFLQFTHFADRLKLLLHALDGHMLASFDGLSLKDLAKGAITLFTLQLVLVHKERSNNMLFVSER